MMLLLIITEDLPRPRWQEANEIEENLDSSDAAWIKKFRDNIQAASDWMPPLVDSEAGRTEDRYQAQHL